MDYRIFPLMIALIELSKINDSVIAEQSEQSEQPEQPEHGMQFFVTNSVKAWRRQAPRSAPLGYNLIGYLFSIIHNVVL